MHGPFGTQGGVVYNVIPCDKESSAKFRVGGAVYGGGGRGGCCIPQEVSYTLLFMVVSNRGTTSRSM